MSCGQSSTTPVSLKCLPSSISYKRVFVTGGTYESIIADDFCNSAARTAKLGGKWVAWFSTEGPNPTDHKHAKDRLIDVGPWYDISGKLVVRSLSDLIQKGPEQPIHLDQTGVSILSSKNTLVWTGTKADGTIDPGKTCQQDSTTISWNTTSSNLEVQLGDASQVGSKWTAAALATDPPYCDSYAHLYCFEQDCPSQ